MVSAVVGVPKINYNGFTSYHLARWPIPSKHKAVATIDLERKLVFHKAEFCIDAVVNSWKYDKELQFVTLSRVLPEVVNRVDKEKRYFRLESGYIPLSRETASRFIDIGYKILDILDATEPRRTTVSKVVSGETRLEELM